MSGLYCMKKLASGPVGDFLGAATGSALLSPFGGIAGGIGSAAGAIPAVNKKDRDKMSEASTAASFVPGIGTYRVSQRLRGVADESNAAGAKHPYKNWQTEGAGLLTSPMFLSMLGAAAGGLGGIAANGASGDGDVMASAAGGAALGGVAGGAIGGAGVLAGILAAAITKRRTKTEQTANDNKLSHVFSNLLVPGVGTYRGLKRYGASGNWNNS